MNRLIDAALNRNRTVILLFILILFSGTAAYISIPKESAPDVKIPIIYVSMTHEGISPEDAERLLIRPMEKELQSIDGIKEMRASALQGFASVILEFSAGFDNEKALNDVREKVDQVKSELPEETKEPKVQEVNLSLFPVVSVILRGMMPERTLSRIARNLRDKLEEIPSVLEVRIKGEREETVEVNIDPLLLESYGLTSDIVAFVQQNNVLVAAGALNSDEGQFNVKVPGLLEDVHDILSLPIKVNNDTVVTVADVATVRKSFRDATNIARVNGEPTLVLEVVKRTGENIIETIRNVRSAVAEEQAFWPAGLDVLFAQDESENIQDMLSDLQNNILFAILLVGVVIIAAIGTRSAGLISLAIPGSFLIGILVISGLDLTLNIVVLFSLILSIGMLVDSAIVVIEYANRRMADNVDFRIAYGEAAKRMSWPLIASTVTTLIVFAPLLVWPGIVGQFMKYMPLTLIATLSGSLIMALIIIPVLGTFLGKSDKITTRSLSVIQQTETGTIDEVISMRNFTGKYTKLLSNLLNWPLASIGAVTTIVVVAFLLFGIYGRGVEFFPDIEPENAQIIIHARGNLSVAEKDALAREVEDRIFSLKDEITIFYSNAGNVGGQREITEDTIAIIQLEFVDWKYRRTADEILQDIRILTNGIPGLMIEARKQQGGPPTGKPINLELSSRYPELLKPAAQYIIKQLQALPEIIDLEDTLPIPAIEWVMDVDREQAAKYSISMQTVGNFIKLVTNGLKMTTYRPDDTDEEIDILLRFPDGERGLSQLDQLRAITSQGAIPISNFVVRNAEQQVGQIRRTDSKRVVSIKADVVAGVVADNIVNKIRTLIKESYTNGSINPNVRISYKGEQEDQQQAATFLRNAFLLALFTMMIVLVTQFNSLYQTIIIMSAIILSTAGVLIGLLITQQPFGIVMCGVGTIALAGIVVNNNIIFIDTYNILRKEGSDVREALIRTGAQRLRPILLTAVTTVLGLVPMVTAVNIDFIAREINVGAPSTQWWQQLSTAIAGGLSFATILTLFLTPCLILVFENIIGRFKSQSKRAL